jgi:hypothetical protein
MTSAPAPFRLLRTAAVATSVLSLAAGAHLLGGGQLPPVPLMGACMALVVLCAVLLTGRKIPVPVMAGVLVAGQGILHETFTVLSPSGPPAAASAAHVHHGSPGAPAPSAGPELHGHLTADFDPPMLGLHIAATLVTLVTAMLLARGEEALWALAAWLRPLRGLSAVRILFPSPVAAPVPSRAMARRWRILHRQPPRGPPAAA